MKNSAKYSLEKCTRKMKPAMIAKTFLVLVLLPLIAIAQDSAESTTEAPTTEASTEASSTEASTEASSTEASTEASSTGASTEASSTGASTEASSTGATSGTPSTGTTSVAPPTNNCGSLNSCVPTANSSQCVENTETGLVQQVGDNCALQRLMCTYPGVFEPTDKNCASTCPLPPLPSCEEYQADPNSINSTEFYPKICVGNDVSYTLVGTPERYLEFRCNRTSTDRGVYRPIPDFYCYCFEQDEEFYVRVTDQGSPADAMQCTKISNRCYKSTTKNAAGQFTCTRYYNEVQRILASYVIPRTYVVASNDRCPQSANDFSYQPCIN